MANVKITALPATAGLSLADIFPVVDDPGGAPATQKSTFTQLVTLLNTLYSTSATAPSAGAGSPEGVVTGDPGKPYTDTSTGDFWVKQTGVGNTGWLQLIAS